MNIASVVNDASNWGYTQASGQVGVTVLKKALDAEAQVSIALIAALPAVANLPISLGNSINTVA